MSMIERCVTSSGGIGLTCPEPPERELKKGDRVIVKIYAQASWRGVITGEGRAGRSWHIVKDGTKWSRGIHKTFVRAELNGKA
jgi:hypothetical protein